MKTKPKTKSMKQGSGVPPRRNPQDLDLLLARLAVRYYLYLQEGNEDGKKRPTQSAPRRESQRCELRMREEN